MFVQAGRVDCIVTEILARGRANGDEMWSGVTRVWQGVANGALMKAEETRDIGRISSGGESDKSGDKYLLIGEGGL